MVDVKTEQREPYVIVVPKAETDSAAWARSVNAKLVDAQPIDAKLNGNGSSGEGSGK